MADRKSVQTEGYQLELEHLTQEKKLMQQLLQMCTEQYAEVCERFPEEDAMKIHKDYLKKQLGRYQQCVRIAEWRAKKLRGITFGREEYPTFCEKFPAGRIPLVPNNLLKKFSVQNMRFSLAVRNPFVITGWDFGDPEGGDTTLRTVNFGVNFTL